MLKSLHVKNFTVFEDAKFEFSPGLNVVVGANGTGKSHVLKLGYAVMQASYKLSLPFSAVATLGQITFSKADWQLALGINVREVFRTEGTGRLTRRQAGSSSLRAGVHLLFEKPKAALSFSFSTRSQKEVAVTELPSKELVRAAPILLPAKEVLSFYRGFGSILRKFELQFDRSYLDLWDALTLPPLRVQPPIIKELLEPTMQGRIALEGEEFVFYPLHGEKLEINMVAEGIRKLGMLSVLLANGSLTPDTTLFWDEPEANLNPQLIKKLAEILVLLARQKFQIVLATHSLFLMRELHVLTQQAPTPIQYFSLGGGQMGEPTTVETADELPLLPNIAALTAELELAEDYLDTLNKPHAGIL